MTPKTAPNPGTSTRPRPGAPLLLRLLRSSLALATVLTLGGLGFGQTIASVPFTDGFEGATLSQYWTVSTVGPGYAAVSTAYGPKSGQSHLLIASSIDATAAEVEVTVALDLAGQSGLVLGFSQKEFDDEDNPKDGIWVSNDGTTWSKIKSLVGADGSSTNTYQDWELDLDAAVASVGLSYSTPFYISLQWRDNFDIPKDGFAFDDFYVGPSITATADLIQLSVDSGGTQTLVLDAGASHALELYVLLGSVSGTTPGQSIDGLQLPLNFDSYFLHTVLHPNSPTLGNSLGVLSSASPGPGGMATATFTLPPGVDSALVGLTVNHAFVVFGWSTGSVTLASNAVPLHLVASPPPPPIGMSQIPAGTFVMGDHYDVGGADEKPLHTVSLDAFYMDVFETTNGAYIAYLNSALSQGLIYVQSGVVYKLGGYYAYAYTDLADTFSPIHWDGTGLFASSKSNHPTSYVSWYGAIAFANWRSTQAGLSPCYDLTPIYPDWSCDFGANGYRLPTESEWEYAARGGQQPSYYKYPWGNTIDGSMANYSQSGDPYEGYMQYPNTSPVGDYMPNGFGLYDMAGNVEEWCWDSGGTYPSSPSSNPHGPTLLPASGHPVIRGGSFYYAPIDLRSARRWYVNPEGLGGTLGFRLVRATQ